MHQTDTPSDAESLAIKALTFLASDPERLGRFLAITGLGPETIRKAASDPGFLAAILDYLSADETLLVTFSANAGIAPEKISIARSINKSHMDENDEASGKNS